MASSAHEKRIEKIEAECVEIKKQILQLEFQHKKDIVEFSKESDERWKKIDKQSEQTARHLEQLSAHANHLSKLTGIAFEDFDELDGRLESASVSLSRKRKKTK